MRSVLTASQAVPETLKSQKSASQQGIGQAGAIHKANPLYSEAPTHLLAGIAGLQAAKSYLFF